MSHSIFDGLSVVSLERTGLTVQQLLDSTLIQNTVTIEDHNVTSTDSAVDHLNSDYTTISVIDESFTFDDDDLFQCGRCKMQFSALDAFMLHKRSQCSYLKVKKNNNHRPIRTSSSVECDSETTFNQVTSSISTKDVTQVQSSQGQDEKYDCALTSTAAVNHTVDGEYFNLALDGSQVFTLNENLQLTSGENDKIIESKNGSLFTTSSTLLPDIADTPIPTSTSLPEIVTEEINDASNPAAKNSEDAIDLPWEDPKTDISTYTHSLFHGRMAKTVASKESTKIRTKHHCSLCNKAFTKNFDLQQHIRSHTGEKPFQCIVCGRAFAQKSNVKKHMLTHKVWPKDSVCYTLPKEPIKKVLSIPVSGEQNKEEAKEEVLVDDSYVCPFCSMVYASYMELRSHMKHHSDQKVYRCIQKDCDKTFLELDAFLDHINVHEKELQYRCHTCSKVFNSLHSLGYHQFEHSIYPWPKKSGPSYFRCTKCLNKYASAEALDHHLKMTKHHFPCQQCSRVFYSERLLRMHIRVHGNVNLFTCATCCKDFKSEHSLKMHQLIHTGEKPFECQICTLAFNRKDKLKRHMLVHEAKRFKCPFSDTFGCQREFRRNDKLRLHLLTHAQSSDKSSHSQDTKLPRRGRNAVKLKTNSSTVEAETGDSNGQVDTQNVENKVIKDADSSSQIASINLQPNPIRLSKQIAELPKLSANKSPVMECPERSRTKIKRLLKNFLPLVHQPVSKSNPVGVEDGGEKMETGNNGEKLETDYGSEEVESIYRSDEVENNYKGDVLSTDYDAEVETDYGVEKKEMDDDEFVVSYPKDVSDDQEERKEIEIIYIPILPQDDGRVVQNASPSSQKPSLTINSNLIISSENVSATTGGGHQAPADATESSISEGIFISRREHAHFATTQLESLGTADILLTQPNCKWYQLVQKMR